MSAGSGPSPGPAVWDVKIPGDWNVGKIPSGGMVTYVALQPVTAELARTAADPSRHPGLKRATAHPNVLSANVHFLSSTLPGPATVVVRVLKSGRTTSTVSATLRQRGTDCLTLLATCGNLEAAAAAGPNLARISADAGPPVLPPIEQCERIETGDTSATSVRSRVLLIADSAVAEQYRDCRKTSPDGTYTDEMLRKRAIATQRGVADYAGYCQLADGTEPMLSEAPLYLDAGIPPIFGVGGIVPGWVPTVNWTVQYKAHPSKGPLRFRFKTSHVVGGFLEEDGELWDTDGKLVAMSRQLALLGVSQTNRAADSSKL